LFIFKIIRVDDPLIYIYIAKPRQAGVGLKAHHTHELFLALA